MELICRESASELSGEGPLKTKKFSLNPGQECFRIHWHDAVELLRVLRGEMLVDLGTGHIRLCAGELLIVPPRVSHRGNAGDFSLEYDMVILDVRNFYNETPVCKQYLPAIFDGRVQLRTVTSDPEIIRCYSALCCVQNQDSLAVIAGVYQLLHLLVQRCVISVDTHVREHAAKEILSYLEEHFSENLSNATLCERFGYTSAYLSAKLKAATGLTPMVYLRIYRLERAQELIRAGAGSISEIAAQCGFLDPNYFTRCFKAHFGMPPTHCKKR